MSDETEEKPKEKKPRKKRATKKKAAPVVDLVALEGSILPKRTEAETRLAMVSKYPVETEAHATLFGKILTSARAELDTIETQRKAMKAPVLEAGKQIDALFRPWREMYEKISEICSRKIADYSLTARADQATALTAVGQGSRDPDTLAKAHATGATPEGLSERETIEVEIADFDQIPRGFLCFDKATALTYLAAKRKAGVPQDQLAIPGVTITWGIRHVRTPGGAK